MKSKEQKRAEAIERAREFYRDRSRSSSWIQKLYPEEEMYLDKFRRKEDRVLSA